MGWNDYKREESPSLEKGDYRVVITEVEQKISSKGNDMLVIHMRTCINNTDIKAYIVDNEHRNKNLTKFYDSFTDIPEGNMQFLGWIGAMGAIKIDINDNGYPEFKWFISAKKAEKLPPWQGVIPERNIVSDGFYTIAENVDDDDDLPF